MTCDERDAEERAMIEAIGHPAYDTLTRLNWLYGFGDLASVKFDKSTGEGTVMIRRRHLKNTARRFRIVNGTVHYRGRQGKAKRHASTVEVFAGVGSK